MTVKEKRGSWVVAGGRADELAWCMRCGVGLKVQTPMPLYLAAALMKAFAEHHGNCLEVGYQEPVPKTPEEWARSRDVGVSSGTIYAAATGKLSPIRHFDVPHDADDFGRCYRLLKLFPEMRDKLPAAAHLCPQWKPFVVAWDELTARYEAALAIPLSPLKSASTQAASEAWEEFHGRIQSLEQRRNDG